MPSAIQHIKQRYPLVRPLITFAACGLAYYIVLTVFLNIPVFNGETQFRPASGVGPVLGLFFGWPGILGCAVGNLVSDMGSESNPLMLAVYTAIQVIYNAIPYVMWYVIRRSSKNPYPSLASAKKVALFLMATVAASTAVTLMLMPFETDRMAFLDIHLVRFLNNELFLIYLGMPLLIALEFSPLKPRAPFFAETPYERPDHMNLSQRCMTTAILVAIVVIGLEAMAGPYRRLLKTESDYAVIIDRVYLNVSIMTVVIVLPAVAVIGLIEKHFTRPIERLTEASRSFAVDAVLAAHNADASFDTKIDEAGIEPSYEVRELFDATDKMRADLVEYVSRLAEATAERERVGAELDVARRIQLAAVPHDFSSLIGASGVDIAGFMRPARMVGGDFYDVFEAGEGHIAFVVGDVSGKGVPAALFMMRAQGLLREQIQTCEDMGAAFTAVNKLLCERNDENLFVTAFACVLDFETGHVVFANAGHNPPLLIRDGAPQYFRPRPGLVLGAMDMVRYRQSELDFAPGDRMLIYTDGVTEAADVHDELYGEERFEKCIHALMVEGAVSMEAIIEGLTADVDAFAGDAPQADDITILGFGRPACTSRIELVPEEEKLEQLFGWLGPLCARPGMTPKMLSSLMLVMEELFVNICHYGFPDGIERRPVVVEAQADDESHALTLTLIDEGVAYDPLTFEGQKVADADTARIGGLGILLVKKNVDDIAYRRAGARNVLRIVKTYV